MSRAKRTSNRSGSVITPDKPTPAPATPERRHTLMLGKVDFANAPSFEPVDSGDYDGQTVSWEPKPTKAGDSTNIEAKFTFEVEDANGQTRQRTLLHRWNLKPQALWRIKRDLVAMGADPADFESANVDLESVLDRLFGAVPTPVRLTIGKTPRTDIPPDENGQPVMSNELVKVAAR